MLWAAVASDLTGNRACRAGVGYAKIGEHRLWQEKQGTSTRGQATAMLPDGREAQDRQRTPGRRQEMESTSDLSKSELEDLAGFFAGERTCWTGVKFSCMLRTACSSGEGDRRRKITGRSCCRPPALARLRGGGMGEGFVLHDTFAARRESTSTRTAWRKLDKHSRTSDLRVVEGACARWHSVIFGSLRVL